MEYLANPLYLFHVCHHSALQAEKGAHDAKFLLSHRHRRAADFSRCPERGRDLESVVERSHIQSTRIHSSRRCRGSSSRDRHETRRQERAGGLWKPSRPACRTGLERAARCSVQDVMDTISHDCVGNGGTWEEDVDRLVVTSAQYAPRTLGFDMPTVCQTERRRECGCPENYRDTRCRARGRRSSTRDMMWIITRAFAQQMIALPMSGT